MKRRRVENSDTEISDEEGEGDYEKTDENVPPLYTDDLDEFDTSGACLMIIDGPTLKKTNESDYDLLLRFWFKCLRKRNLPLFTHPGEPDEDGGLVSSEGDWVRNNKELINLAEQAVTLYNELSKAKKLEFKEVVKVNSYFCFVECYLTFSAINLDTGETGMYQAAFKKCLSEHVLGLLREWSTEKILVIMSITGAEKELAANRKFYEQLKAMEKEKKSNQV